MIYSINSRFTKEERQSVEYFKNRFGEDMTKYLILVFTGKDNLDFDGTTLDAYLATAGPELKVAQNLDTGCVVFS